VKQLILVTTVIDVGFHKKREFLDQPRNLQLPKVLIVYQYHMKL